MAAAAAPLCSGGAGAVVEASVAPPPLEPPLVESAAGQKSAVDATADAGDGDEVAGGGEGGSGEGGVEAAVDFTRIPAALDAKLEALDEAGALRPTRLKVGDRMSLRSQKALLAAPQTTSLGAAEQQREKQRAFDLLDAISRAGSLPIACASLHVVIAATHAFDRSLVDTLVVKNVNPIEKLERSALIVAETIHGRPAHQLVHPDAYERVATFAAPALLPPRDAHNGGAGVEVGDGA